MFNEVSRQLGHMADIYQRDIPESAPHIPVVIYLRSNQINALVNALPILQDTLHGKIQDTSVDAPTWDNFMAIAKGLYALIATLPIAHFVQSSDALPTQIPSIPLPQYQEDLLGLLSFLSCAIVEVHHETQNATVSMAYNNLSEAGASLFLFYAQSLQGHPDFENILARYSPEIQLAHTIVRHDSPEEVNSQRDRVRGRIEKHAIEKIDNEEL